MTIASANLVFNERALPGISDTSADCYVGIKFATNYVGVL